MTAFQNSHVFVSAIEDMAAFSCQFVDDTNSH